MVDILLAVYNGEKYLDAQLQSIADQTYKNWRLIIRDDRSTDRSVEIAQKFKAQQPEGKVCIYVNEKGTGSAKGNFIKLMGDTDAAYVMFCDQDDVWLSDKIEKTLKAMQQCEKTNAQEKDIPILVHSDLYVVDESLELLSASFRKYQNLPVSTAINQLMIQNSVTGCTVMVNRALMAYMKRVKDADKMVMHDYWAALVAEVFGKIVYINEPLIKYRQHGHNSVGASNARGFTYLYRRFKAGKKEFRLRMRETMVQIGYFCEVYADELKDYPYKEMMIQFANLENSTRMGKFKYYASNNVTKYGIIRRTMQFIWS